MTLLCGRRYRAGRVCIFDSSASNGRLGPGGETTLGLGAFAWGRAAETPSRELQTVTIRTRDFAFQAPDSLQAGPVNIRLLNAGKELHHVWMIRLGGGHTLDEAFAAFKATGRLPGWVKEFGGPNTPRPAGGESNATAALEARTPKAVVVVTLEDFAFTFSRSLRPGKQVIEIRNAGRPSHEMVLVRLVPGKTAHDVIASIENSTVEPGSYALICFIPDMGDGKPHFMHGMMKEFDVGDAHTSR